MSHVKQPTLDGTLSRACCLILRICEQKERKAGEGRTGPYSNHHNIVHETKSNHRNSRLQYERNVG
jgi:hypothetical protein